MHAAWEGPAPRLDGPILVFKHKRHHGGGLRHGRDWTCFDLHRKTVVDHHVDGLCSDVGSVRDGQDQREGLVLGVDVRPCMVCAEHAGSFVSAAVTPIPRVIEVTCRDVVRGPACREQDALVHHHADRVANDLVVDGDDGDRFGVVDDLDGQHINFRPQPTDVLDLQTYVVQPNVLITTDGGFEAAGLVVTKVPRICDGWVEVRQGVVDEGQAPRVETIASERHVIPAQGHICGHVPI